MTRQEKLIEKSEFLLETERQKRVEGFALIGGADEAGRGPLAGPVVAACVVMPSNDIVLGIDDSKKLSEKKREELYEIIMEKAASVGVGIVDKDVIDEINILNATRLAFENAINSMETKPDYIYTDAMDKLKIDIPYEAVIKADAKIYCVGAASIIAKVTRDRIMRKIDEEYPRYGFAKHKGYGTKQHTQAILEYGATPYHRMTFLKKLLGNK